MKPFHLYVHFPFCKARCPYCAFYFVVGRRDDRAGYLDAVAREIRRASRDERFLGRTVASVYFGGGTPGLMEPRSVEAVLDAARSGFPIAADAEVSLEANPDGIDEARLRGFRDAGVNRVTFGWQSLRSEHLRRLGRTHGAEDSTGSLRAARQAGFDNVGVDLMFGLPGQTAAEWARDLARVAELRPDHVSTYELTIEEDTRFFRERENGRLVVPDEDARADMFQAADDVLGDVGVRRYEISNLAREGRECAHNVAGWRGGDLLGVGASAASHVRNTRWTNVADLDEYVRCLRSGEAVDEPPEILDERTWAAEDLYLGLRLVTGLDASSRLARVPEPGRGALRTVLEDGVRSGLLEKGRGRTRLSARGLLLADEIFAALLAPCPVSTSARPPAGRRPRRPS